MLIQAALTGQPLPQGLEAAIARGAAARFPVTAKDLIAQGYEGAALGQRLAALKDAWISAGFAPGRAELLALPE
ncbi:hypothetical protein [Mangrovicoccus ximenensis]|uniref:hypothetical protein n=1 Tax=Mangrovicoccus ximenensis TaxID=1911570 RepID=UPI000D35707A|nr:hypothetical protein [Mangrovicoccus ximenensis]